MAAPSGNFVLVREVTPSGASVQRSQSRLGDLIADSLSAGPGKGVPFSDRRPGNRPRRTEGAPRCASPGSERPDSSALGGDPRQPGLRPWRAVG